MNVSTQSAPQIAIAKTPGFLASLKRAIWGMRCGLEAHRLWKKSDAELARMGLRRDAIAFHAFPLYRGE